jgi:hypothetical protein
MRKRNSGFGGISVIITDLNETEAVIDKKAQHIGFRTIIIIIIIII